jgi:hypothetical protein
MARWDDPGRPNRSGAAADRCIAQRVRRGRAGPAPTSPARRRERARESRRRLRQRRARSRRSPSAPGRAPAGRRPPGGRCAHRAPPGRGRRAARSIRSEPLLVQPGSEVLDRHRHVADLPARRLSDLPDGVGERQQAGAGQLVDLAHMAVVGQRGDRDVGDVVGVDERLRRVRGRERELPASRPSRK